MSTLNLLCVAGPFSCIVIWIMTLRQLNKTRPLLPMNTICPTCGRQLDISSPLT
jgi:hypothetical protein